MVQQARGRVRVTAQLSRLEVRLGLQVMAPVRALLGVRLGLQVMARVRALLGLRVRVTAQVVARVPVVARAPVVAQAPVVARPQRVLPWAPR